MGRRGMILVLLGLVTVLIGCGGSSMQSDVSRASHTSPSKQEWRVTLDSIDGPESVGILMAEHSGFFKRAGLKVWAGSPLEPDRPASYVAKGTDDFGLVQMPQLVIARAKGMPLVAIGSVVSRPTAALIWLKKAKIRSLTDLKGKTIAIPGTPFQRRFLRAMLVQAGVAPAEVRVKKVGYNLVGALMAGHADAIFGGSKGIEGVKLEARGAKPVVTPVTALGMPSYEELAVVTREELVAEDPQLVRQFMTAVARGSSAAAEDPKGAVDAVVQGLEANPPPSRGVMEAQMRATRPFLSRTGHLSSARAQTLVSWMYREGIIDKEIQASEFIDDVLQ